MRKLIYTISLGLSLSLLTSCAIAPPDVPVCIEDAPGSGFCVNTISGKEFTVDDQHPYVVDGRKQSWLDMRPYMILMPFSSWATIKKFIIDVCKMSNQCTGKVANWERTVGTIDSEAQTKGTK